MADPMTSGQRRALFAQFNNVYPDASRDKRLRWTAEQVARDITSWNDITLHEAIRLLSILDAEVRHMEDAW